MYDVITGNRTFHQLFQARANFQAVMKNDKILFFTGEPNSRTVEVYNTNMQTWSGCELPQSMANSGIVSTGDKVYVAGGVVDGVLSSRVWLVDF